MDGNMEKCNVFISYRRSDGVYPAYLLYKDLVEKGYSVFMDVNSLRNGDFPDIIYNNISSCIDFVLVVTPDTFSEKIFCEMDWVRKEISLALHYNKNIVPLFINSGFPDKLPEEIDKVKNFNGLAQFDANLIREVHSKLSKDYIISKPIPVNTASSASDILKRHCSIYDANYGNEFERLKIQAGNAYQSDKAVLEKVTSNLCSDRPVVLDIGCAYGFVGKTRFINEKFAKIIGIDISQRCISYAQNNQHDDRFVYEVIDIEDDSFESKMHEIMIKYNIQSFDIVFCALVIHHLKEPKKFIRKIRNFISPAGYLVIRGSDDGSKLSFGDNGLMDKIIDMTLAQTGVSDRLNGRKIYNLLSLSNYENITIESYMRDTSHFSYDDRQLLFQESFAYRINYFRKNWEKDPSNESNKHSFDEMENMLAKFEEVFYDNNFWYCEYDYIGYAQK